MGTCGGREEAVMAYQATMLGTWMVINNPNKAIKEDLNLTVGGTIMLNTEALRLLGGQLLTVRIDVKDHDAIGSDDLLKTDQSFQIGIHDTEPHCFHTGVIVPHKKLNNCEGWFDHTAEVYCRVSAGAGGVHTNAANTETKNVKIGSD
jgi:hypothetical protein